MSGNDYAATIVVPVKDEEDSVAELVQRLSDALNSNELTNSSSSMTVLEMGPRRLYGPQRNDSSFQTWISSTCAVRVPRTMAASAAPFWLAFWLLELGTPSLSTATTNIPPKGRQFCLRISCGLTPNS
jgi:hypothetical protein